jgi:hypothetical protein
MLNPDGLAGRIFGGIQQCSSSHSGDVICVSHFHGCIGIHNLSLGGRTVKPLNHGTTDFVNNNNTSSARLTGIRPNRC